MASVHGHAESDLPKRVVLELAVDPDGESYVWADEVQPCTGTVALVAAAATYGREKYPAIVRLAGSAETPAVRTTAAA